MKLLRTIIRISFLFVANNVAWLMFAPAKPRESIVGQVAWGILAVVVAIVYLLYVNVRPAEKLPDVPRYLQGVYSGNQLLVQTFWLLLLDVLFSVILLVWFVVPEPNKYLVVFVINIVVNALCLFILVCNTLVRLYASSVQLGVKKRVLFFFFWWIPVWGMALWYDLYATTKREYKTELERIKLNNSRKTQQLCNTKYPVLLVHGVFFRDSEVLNYWGRVPQELIENGAAVYYGNHQSAASVEDSGQELAVQISKIVEDTGCDKVNVIAHSKGGLDCRYAIAKCGVADLVASLTTINSPHRGCKFADYLLEKMPQGVVNAIATKYNAALRKIGDHNPDFLQAVTSLRESCCLAFNEQVPDSPQVYYQSVGSVLVRTRGGKFPMNLSAKFVKMFDGENDGLVSLDSMEWGKRFIKLDSDKRRGISHADMIDLYRENTRFFDVREFYVGLVAQLKEQGY